MSDTIPQNNPQGKHYVYALAYPESMGGRFFYIGKGSGRRINWHETEARLEKDENPYKCNVIRKIWSKGEKVVKIVLAYFDNEKDAFDYEIALIFFMNGLTNLNDGGEGQSNPSEETRRKMSESHKGKGAIKGHVVTDETKKKLREANKGKSPSEETRKKIGESSKGNQNNKGRIFSEETKQRMRDAHKGRTHTEETKRKQRESALIRESNKRKKGEI